jgi:hypothetical protein
MNKRTLIALTLFVSSVMFSTPRVETRGQDSTTTKITERSSTSITGRVVNESGQPVPNAIVSVFGIGTQRPERRNTNSDEDGTFRAVDLPRGVYNVSARARGYVFVPDPTEPGYYRPGDSVTLKVKKGGVITGTVTDMSGEPVVGIRVSAVPHRDSEGRTALGLGAGFPAYTDDRGIYRLFGLSPGFYLVAAGGKVAGFIASAFDDDAPTFYPSSTRETGAEITVHYNDESTGINIRYRGDRGYAVSGVVLGIGDPRGGADVRLVRASSGAIEGVTNTQLRGKDNSFAFYGVSEGDYYIIAQRYSNGTDDGARSLPIPVKVRNQPVAGVEITLNNLSSISGRLIIDAAAANDKGFKCETTRTPSIEEALISARRDQEEAAKALPFMSLPTSTMGAPNDKGEFLLQRIEAGHYRIETRTLDDAWYIRAIKVAGTARTTTTVDAGRNGFPVKGGERVGGLTVTVAEGAASLRGSVAAQKEGAALPERLRVHLVPAEKELADDTLRFAETAVQSDGTFSLNNLAPGRYWLLTSQASPEEASERSPRPIAWKTSSRASLRRDGEALNLSLELKPCQRITDYKLRYAPAKAQPAK